MNKASVTRRSALKLGVLSAVGGTTVSQQLTAVRASKHEPPSEDEVNLSNNDVKYIEPDPDAGFNYPYFLYIPSNTKSLEGYDRPLYVEPSSTGGGKDSFKEILDWSKRNLYGIVIPLADRIGIPAIHPVLPKYKHEPYENHVNAQHLTPHVLTIDEDEPIARPDKQLLAMVDDARQRLTDAGHTLTEQIHLNGLSASGMFTARFTAMHPERVNAMSPGGLGTYILPMEELSDAVPVEGDPSWDSLPYPEGSLPYPAGVYDLPDLIGKEFNRKAWKSVNKYLWLGKDDQPLKKHDDITGSEDTYLSFMFGYREEEILFPSKTDYYGIPDLMQDIFGRHRVETRWPVTKAAYTSIDPNAQFKLYDGVGHRTPNKVRNDLVHFHKRQVLKTYGPKVRRTYVGWEAETLTVANPRAMQIDDTLTVRARFENIVSSPQTATLTLTIDGTKAKTVTEEIPPGQISTVEMEYNFTNPGTYTLHVNGKKPGPQPLTVRGLTTTTPTPEPTPTPTPTPSPTPTQTDTPTPDEATATPGASGPGFTFGTAISSVATASYLLAQRFRD